MSDPKSKGLRDEIKTTFLKRLQALAQPEQSKGPCWRYCAGTQERA